MKPHLVYYLPILLLLLCAGCSKKVKVDGMIKFSNGEPLTEGSVFLSDNFQMFQGKIGPDGTFSLGEIRDGDGIPPGAYSAWISGANRTDYVMNAAGMATGKQIQHIVIDPKFTSRKTSGLAFEIVRGRRNKIEIVVEKPMSSK